HAQARAGDRRRRVRQTLERLDEADASDQVQQGHHAHAHHFLSFLRNIASMRRVTRKPPKMFTAASATASTPMVLPRPLSVSAAASIAPTMTIAEIALVTAISGVCSAGVTVHTTW